MTNEQFIEIAENPGETVRFFAMEVLSNIIEMFTNLCIVLIYFILLILAVIYAGIYWTHAMALKCSKNLF